MIKFLNNFLVNILPAKPEDLADWSARKSAGCKI